MTAADGRTESRLCLNLLLQKLCGRKKLSRALGIEKNAAVIVNCKGALSVGKEDGCGKKIIKTLLKIK